MKSWDLRTLLANGGPVSRVIRPTSAVEIRRSIVSAEPVPFRSIRVPAET